MDWNKNLTMSLIEEYRLRPILWDPKHLDYKDKPQKTNAWREITAILEIERVEVERKIRVLTSQYLRELKKQLQKTDDEICNSKWIWFKELQFLSNRSKPVTSTTNKKNSPVELNEESLCENPAEFTVEIETSPTMNNEDLTSSMKEKSTQNLIKLPEKIAIKLREQMLKGKLSLNGEKKFSCSNENIQPTIISNHQEKNESNIQQYSGDIIKTSSSDLSIGKNIPLQQVMTAKRQGNILLLLHPKKNNCSNITTKETHPVVKSDIEEEIVSEIEPDIQESFDNKSMSNNYQLEEECCTTIKSENQEHFASQIEPDHYQMFGNIVAHKIRSLRTEYARQTVEHHINNILYRGFLGEFDSHQQNSTSKKGRFQCGETSIPQPPDPPS